MKRYTLRILIIFLFISFNPLHAEAEKTIEGTVMEYFEVLRNGDIDAIKYYVAEDLYREKKALLEKNEDYPEFLRSFYQGKELRILNSTQAGDDAVAEIGIYSSDDLINVTKVRLKRDSDNTWKIVKENID
jgi:hypothetical protein